MTNEEQMFVMLRDLCISSLENPDVKSLRSLKALITSTNPSALSSVQKYILLPLQNVLRLSPSNANKVEAVILEALSCIRCLFEKSQLESFQTFAELYVSLFCLADDRVKLETKLAPSEDLKMSAIQTTKVLINAATVEVLRDCLSTIQFHKAIGHSVSVLLAIANQERSRLLKLCAMQTLEALLERNISLAQEPQNLEANSVICQDVFAYFLPGVSISVMRLVTSDDKLSQDLVESSLSCFSKIVSLGLSNLELSSTNQEKATTIIKRDTSWVEGTCLKLRTAFKKMIPFLVTSPSLRIRRSLLSFCSQLLLHCDNVFVIHNLECLIEVPLSYTSDESGVLISEAESDLAKFASAFQDDTNSRFVQDSLLDKCFECLGQLPREIRSEDERGKQCKINLLNGLFKVLGRQGVEKLLSLPSHRQRLIQCLIDLSEFAKKGTIVSVLPSLSLKSENDHVSLDWPQKHFQHFESQETESSLRQACATCASLMDRLVLCDFIKDNVEQSNFDPAVLFVCNSFIEGTSFDTLPVDIFNLYLTAHSCEADGQYSSLELSMITEGIIGMAKYLNRESFSEYAVQVVYPLLDNLDKSDEILSETSWTALEKLSRILHHNSRKDLILCCLPQLIESLVCRMKQFKTFDRAPIVVGHILKLTGYEALTQMDEVIELSLNALDLSYQEHPVYLLKLLQSIILSCQQFCEAENRTNELPVECDALDNFRKSLEQFLADQNRVHDLTAEADEDLTGDQEAEIVEDEKKSLPVHAKLTKNILERCVHLLSSSDSDVRVLVMDLISRGTQILTPFENDLLPLVHKLWSPLIKRFSDEVAITRKAFDTLVTLSLSCGDFIRQRTVAEVFPKLLRFLRSQAKISHGKDDYSGYRFTTEYNLQLDALSQSGQLAFRLDVRGKDLWQLLNCLLLYLSVRQPASLRAAAARSVEFVARLEPESVRFYARLLAGDKARKSHDQRDEWQFIRDNFC